MKIELALSLLNRTYKNEMCVCTLYVPLAVCMVRLGERLDLHNYFLRW